GSDTDDRMRQTGEHLRPSDDIGLAMKPLLPHLITEHGHRMRVATDVFTGFEAAAEDRTDTNRVEIVRRHHAAGDALRAIAERERGAGDLLADERVGERAAPLEILEVGPRHVVSPAAAVGAAERDQ